jgi:voltage-gated potassium channel
MLTNVYDCFSIFVPGVGGAPLVKKAPHRLPLCGLLLQGAIIISSFAAAYHALSRLDKDAFGKAMSPVESAYFSLITAATVGYGDIYPKTQTAMLFVMAEVAIGWAYTLFAVASVVSVKLTKMLDKSTGPQEP